MYSGRTRFILIAGFMGLVGLSIPAHARNIMCWENNIGVRECGASVPPEHSQKRIEIINDRGLIVRVIPAAKTKEQQAIDREEARLQREREDRIREQARQDSILLNAYTTERDLILARDNNLKSIEGQIEIARGNLRVLRDNLAHLQKQAANYERSGKKPPEKILKEIEETKVQMVTKEKHVEFRENERDVMAKRFADDLKRFRKLKGEPSVKAAEQ